MKLKSALPLLILLMLSIPSLSNSIGFGVGEDITEVTLLQNDDYRTVIRVDLGTYNEKEVQVDGKTYHELSLPGEGITTERGDPALPFVCRPIIISDNARMVVRVISEKFVEFENYQVAPSKGPILIGTDPTTVVYETGPVYKSDRWLPEEVATISQPFIMRDYRGLVIRLNAFRYNPARQTLRVYTTVTVEVMTEGLDDRAILDRSTKAEAPVRAFDQIYRDRFINYDYYQDKWMSGRAEDLTVGEQGEMLVIVQDDFADSVQQYVNWKRQKGIKTTMVKVSETWGTQASSRSTNRDGYAAGPPGRDIPEYGRCCYGNPFAPSCADSIDQDSCDILGGSWLENKLCGTPFGECGVANASVDIKNYIQNFYDDNPNLVWVLLVGPHPEVSTPTHVFPENHEPADVGRAADPWYSLMDGYYPDLVVGRFSVKTVSQLMSTIARSITYERDLSIGSDTAWYHYGMTIDLDSGNGYMNALRDTLLAHTYTHVDSFRKDGATGWPPSQDYIDSLDLGRSVLIHRGHGSPGGWNCGIYSYTINALSNNNRWPYIQGIGCNTAPIEDGNSFGETWLRASDGSNDPIGAVGVYMASILQYSPWVEDSQAEFVRLLANGENTALGALYYNGSCFMKMNDQSSNESHHQFLGWQVLGDPSLQVRTDTPIEINVTIFDATLFYTATACSVLVQDAGSNPVEDALCALYREGVLFGSGYTNSDGAVNIPITETINVSGPVWLTVTGFNLKTWVDSIPVVYDVNITHTGLDNSENCHENVLDANGYEVVATVYAQDPPDSVSLKYRYDGGAWDEVEMTPVARYGYEYSAYIPLCSASTDIDYNIYAMNEDSLEQTSDTYSFHVLGYKCVVTPVHTFKQDLYEESVYLKVTVLNDGIFTDIIDLEALPIGADSANWPAVILDSTGSDTITATTDSLARDASFAFLVEVVIGSDRFGDSCEVLVIATSQGDTVATDTASVWAVSEGEPLAVPFEEFFDEDTLDLSRWMWTCPAYVDSLANYVTSDPKQNSLHINGASVSNNGCPVKMNDKRVRSRCIDLSEETQIWVQYWYEQGGYLDDPETDDDLVIEYLDSLGDWHELSRQLGQGRRDTAFSVDSISLPNTGDTTAYHRHFRIMIRPETYGSDLDMDDWFVDNIRVYNYCCRYRGDVDHSNGPMVVSDLTYMVAYMFQGGPAPPCFEEGDVNNDGDIGVADLNFMVAYLFQSGPAPDACD